MKLSGTAELGYCSSYEHSLTWKIKVLIGGVTNFCAHIIKYNFIYMNIHVVKAQNPQTGLGLDLYSQLTSVPFIRTARYLFFWGWCDLTCVMGNVFLLSQTENCSRLFGNDVWKRTFCHSAESLCHFSSVLMSVWWSHVLSIRPDGRHWFSALFSLYFACYCGFVNFPVVMPSNQHLWNINEQTLIFYNEFFFWTDTWTDTFCLSQ